MLRLPLHWQILIAMVIGAGVGLALNFSAGEYTTPQPATVKAEELHPYGLASAVTVSEGSVWVHDQPGQVQMQIVELNVDGETSAVRRVFVGALEAPKISRQEVIGQLRKRKLLSKAGKLPEPADGRQLLEALVKAGKLKRSEAQRILRQLPKLSHLESIFFSVPLGPEKELNASRIPGSLKKAFEAEGHPLPPDSSISVVEAGRVWNIGAEDSRYVVRKSAKVLNIFVHWPALPNDFSGRPAETIVPSLGELKKKDPGAYALFLEHGRSTARTTGDLLKMIGDLFLRMLKMVSVPLIIFSLLSGVLGLGHADRLGKMFGRTILYYLATSLLAICTGLAVFTLIDPGAPEAAPEKVETKAEKEKAEKGQKQGKALETVLFEQVEALIPSNPAQAVANGKFLSIIAFTLMFAVFAVLVGGRTVEFFSQFASAGFHVMMKMTMAIIALAPIGVLCLMLFATATQGITVFERLGWYMLTVACALLFHAAVILPLILKFVARRSPWEFAKAMSPALFTAFSSASSNATLPLTLTSVEQRAGVSNRVSSFVLPLGATVNMDGTALYEVIAVLFIANLTPGVDLAFYQQVIVAFTALLASVGAAGIPHAGLVMMVIILQAVGLPTEAQGLIIAVDRILDMCRTAVNVWSDSCGCAVIARFEAGGDVGDEEELVAGVADSV